MPERTSPKPRERVAYINGKIVPESQALVSFRDRGFLYGDAVFDTTRTFGHRIFKLQQHIDRLYRSLKYVQIDPGISPAKLMQMTEEVTAQNLKLLGPDDDYWVSQRISRGYRTPEGDLPQHEGPTVIVECMPLSLRARARLYRDGIDVIVPATRRTPPESVSPRAKTHNYLNLVLADLEAKTRDPEAWAILLDTNGFLTEGTGSNIFTVKNGKVYTPRSQFVLGGISRETVIELAEKIEVPLVETDLDLYDALTADEAFLTSTSLCICGVRSINGAKIGEGTPPGPVTKALIDAYIEFVNFDFVAQHLRRLES
ncbi:MAG: aminotransferase class IV [Chloroflexi bacterium]|nr:aminotransferase class IV [Chloroflexota bacterium]